MSDSEQIKVADEQPGLEQLLEVVDEQYILKKYKDQIERDMANLE